MSIDEKLSRKIANVGIFCMVLVVMQHIPVGMQSDTWSRWVWDELLFVCKIAVPFFFTISGFLLAGHFNEGNWWGREFRKRIKSLIVQYVFWNLFYLCFSVFLTYFASAAGGSYGGRTIADLNVRGVLAALGLIPPFWCQSCVLWFLQCLITYICIAPVFVLFKRRWIGLALLVLVFLFSAGFPYLLPPAEDWKTHFLKCHWVQGFCYFAAGAYLRWNCSGGVGLCQRRTMTGAALVCCGLSLGQIGAVNVLAIPMLMVGVWEVFPDIKIPSWITSASFPIYLLHQGVIVIFAAILRFLNMKELATGSLLACSLLFVIVFLASMGLAVMLRKISPRFSRFAFGGR